MEYELWLYASEYRRLSGFGSLHSRSGFSRNGPRLLLSHHQVASRAAAALGAFKLYLLILSLTPTLTPALTPALTLTLTP